jgi:phosphatidylserine/phosphatidylglycerophosphate/cardiolipin synthase-like enzyme
MSYPFLKLSRPSIESLLKAIESGRVTFPFSTPALASLIATAEAPAITQELNDLWEGGMGQNGLVYLLRSILAERTAQQTQRNSIDLVWTGDEILGASGRDTKIAVQELFQQAQHSVLISSYAIDKGNSAKALFGKLATKMDQDYKLTVRMFLNIQREFKDPTASQVLIRDYAQRFRQEIWPGQRLPEVFYDPRSLEVSGKTRACLHAKCVVVDEEYSLVTSANFTEAAHERNIEAGVMLKDKTLAKALTSQFETLATRKILLPIDFSPIQEKTPQ